MSDGRRSAVIIATDEYEDDALSALRAPRNDANSLAEVLRDPDIGGFDVETHLNKSHHELALALDGLLDDCDSTDVLLIHFACHGVKNDHGELFLAAKNTNATRLQATAISGPWLSMLMHRSPARHITLILDCCFGGAFSKGAIHRAGTAINPLESFETSELETGRGRAIISASGSMEFALDGPEVGTDDITQTSLFTTALVEGLRTGAADTDGNGFVSISEVFDFVRREVRRKNPKQTPKIWNDQQGDVWLARSPYREVKPGVLPAHLYDLETANKYDQLGGVRHLSDLARSTDLPLAVAAIRVLDALRDSDSRAGSKAAKDELEALQPRISPESLELRAVPGEDGVVAARARIEGVPVCCVGPVTCADQRVRVTVREGELRVHLTAPFAGFTGTVVDFKSAAGVVSVPVQLSEGATDHDADGSSLRDARATLEEHGTKSGVTRLRLDLQETHFVVATLRGWVTLNAWDTFEVDGVQLRKRWSLVGDHLFRLSDGGVRRQVKLRLHKQSSYPGYYLSNLTVDGEALEITPGAPVE